MPRWLRISCATVLLVAPPVAAEAQLSFAPRVGTLGLGVDVGVGLLPVATLRAGAGILPVEPRGTFDGIEYEVTLPPAFTLGLDLHPGGGAFRISGGVMLRSGDLAIEATPSGSVEIGDRTFPAEQVGTLRGDVLHADPSPFVTLGLGKHGRPGFGLVLDVGVAFPGEPDVELSADGELSDDPEFQEALEAEEERVRDDLDPYGRYYPIVSLGVRIGFGG